MKHVLLDKKCLDLDAAMARVAAGAGKSGERFAKALKIKAPDTDGRLAGPAR